MANNKLFPGGPGVGLRNVGSYQVSGHPYLSGSTIAGTSTVRFPFPYVTKRIKIQVTGSQRVNLSFVDPDSQSGYTAAKNNYWTIWPAVSGSEPAGPQHPPNAWNASNMFTLDVKVKELYLAADYGTTGVQIAAELTNIPAIRMYALSGSGVVTED
jgi:hypothetical protein